MGYKIQGLVNRAALKFQFIRKQRTRRPRVAYRKVPKPMTSKPASCKVNWATDTTDYNALNPAVAKLLSEGSTSIYEGFYQSGRYP